jgi:hypothetical protein
MKASDLELEAELQEKGLNAPRLTPLDIHGVVEKVMFMRPEDTTLTICVLTLKNGTHVVGESACISPENFSDEIGRKVSFQNAIDKIWALEGYLLKEKLFRASNG